MAENRLRHERALQKRRIDARRVRRLLARACSVVAIEIDWVTQRLCVYRRAHVAADKEFALEIGWMAVDWFSEYRGAWILYGC